MSECVKDEVLRSSDLKVKIPHFLHSNTQSQSIYKQTNCKIIYSSSSSLASKITHSASSRNPGDLMSLFVCASPRSARFSVHNTTLSPKSVTLTFKHALACPIMTTVATPCHTRCTIECVHPLSLCTHAAVGCESKSSQPMGEVPSHSRPSHRDTINTRRKAAPRPWHCDIHTVLMVSIHDFVNEVKSSQVKSSQ